MLPSRVLFRVLVFAFLCTRAIASESGGVQRATVYFPNVGTVRVEALELEGYLPRMVLTEQSTGRLLLSKDMGTCWPDRHVIHRALGVMCSRLPFRVMQAQVLPSPLILAVIMAGDGSDCGYESVVIGAVKGQLKVLTLEPLRTDIEGGIYVGDLGGGHGYGLVRWDFIWGHEMHVDPHQFEVEIFHFDPAESVFKLERKISSKEKYSTAGEFLSKLGLHCRNLLLSFPGFGC